jgi:hypothetical protein
MGLHSNGSLLALPANIRLGWKRMAVVSTQAYFDTATITAVKIIRLSILLQIFLCAIYILMFFQTMLKLSLISGLLGSLSANVTTLSKSANH